MLPHRETLKYLLFAEHMDRQGQWEYAAWLRIRAYGRQQVGDQTMLVYLNRPEHKDQVRVVVSGTTEEPTLEFNYRKDFGEPFLDPDHNMLNVAYLARWDKAKGWEFCVAQMAPWNLFTSSDYPGLLKLAVEATVRDTLEK